MTTNDQSFDLIGIGIAAVDEVVELPAFPQPDTKMPAVSIQRHGGGQCTTALVAAARLGLKCGYAGLLGENELSDFTRGYLGREGIAVRENRGFPDARPYYAVVLVDRSTGDRTILYTKDGVREPRPEDVPLDWLRRTRALLADQLGPEATVSACRIARELGVEIIADLERVDLPELQEIVRLADHLILPLRIARELTGRSHPADAVAVLAEQARRCTAVTWGAQGCWFVCGGGVQHQPAYRVAVVDTTGCGDVFHGAYAAAILDGLAVTEAIRFASATAALKATRTGGQAGIPSRDAVDRFLRSAHCVS